jgi:hypothetical protein
MKGYQESLSKYKYELEESSKWTNIKNVQYVNNVH